MLKGSCSRQQGRSGVPSAERMLGGACTAPSTAHSTAACAPAPPRPPGAAGRAHARGVLCLFLPRVAHLDRDSDFLYRQQEESEQHRGEDGHLREGMGRRLGARQGGMACRRAATTGTTYAPNTPCRSGYSSLPSRPCTPAPPPRDTQ